MKKKKKYADDIDIEKIYRETFGEDRPKNYVKKIDFCTPFHNELINLFNEYNSHPEKIEHGYHTSIIKKRKILMSIIKTAAARRRELFEQYLLVKNSDPSDAPASDEKPEKKPKES